MCNRIWVSYFHTSCHLSYKLHGLLSCLIHRFKKKKKKQIPLTIPASFLSSWGKQNQPTKPPKNKSLWQQDIFCMYENLVVSGGSNVGQSHRTIQESSGQERETPDQVPSPNPVAVSEQELIEPVEWFMDLPSLDKVRLVGCCWRHTEATLRSAAFHHQSTADRALRTVLSTHIPQEQ